MANEKLVSAGGLWKMQSKKDGSFYYQGHVEVRGKKLKILAFSNADKVKENPKAPVLRFVLDTRPDLRGSPSAAPQRPVAQPRRQAPPTPPPVVEDSGLDDFVTDEDIAF